MNKVISLLQTNQQHKETSYIYHNLQTIVADASCALICDLSKILEIDGTCRKFYGDCKKMQIHVQDALEMLVVDIDFDRASTLNIGQRVTDDRRLEEEEELQQEEKNKRTKEKTENNIRCWNRLFEHDHNESEDDEDNEFGGYQCSICAHMARARNVGIQCDDYVGED
jgi:hypothetical protein